MRSVLLLFSAMINPLAVIGADFPSVPVPDENVINADKRVLGKILFWDEQLSVDNSVACGTCHRPEFGGADPRYRRHPGVDGIFNTVDDVFGSPGVKSRDDVGQLLPEGLFGDQVQVTNRASPSYFMGIWAKENFWDGRANGQFKDPESGEVLIITGAGLENQALGPIMNPVEMGKEGRQWAGVLNKLAQAQPLVLATDLPPDINIALENNATYPALFDAAFGSPEITAARIAMALATHERTLVSDQTPWDLAQRNNTFLPGLENLGWEYFQSLGCSDCHTPPLFTDNQFHNTGLREENDDQGRMNVSNNDAQRGDMKTPSLRNMMLKKSFMHTGQFFTLEDAFDSYADVPFINMADKLPNGADYDFNVTESQRTALLAFLKNSLTDPRVAQNQYPFDRPRLRTEGEGATLPLPEPPVNLTALKNENGSVLLQWEVRNTEAATLDFEIIRSDGLHEWTTNTHWLDRTGLQGKDYNYQIKSRGLNFETSSPAQVFITAEIRFSKYLTYSIILILLSGSIYFVRARVVSISRK